MLETFLKMLGEAGYVKVDGPKQGFQLGDKVYTITPRKSGPRERPAGHSVRMEFTEAYFDVNGKLERLDGC